jgi:membrane protease YdiL (CAAX protease family)
VSDALVAARPSSRLREWLRYDESLEAEVDAAFDSFVRQSGIVKAFAGGFIASIVAAIALFSAFHGRRNAYEIAAAGYYACLYIPALIGISRVRKPILLTMLRGAVDPWRGAIYAVGLALIAFTLEIFAAAVLEATHVAGPSQHYERLGLMVLVLSGAVLAPVVEEAFFQGWLQTRFERDFKAGAAAGTTIMFLIYHFPRGLSQYTRGFGLYANAVLRRETRSLGGPILAHCLNNALSIGLLIVFRVAGHRPLHW